MAHDATPAIHSRISSGRQRSFNPFIDGHAWLTVPATGTPPIVAARTDRIDPQGRTAPAHQPGPSPAGHGTAPPRLERRIPERPVPVAAPPGHRRGTSGGRRAGTPHWDANLTRTVNAWRPVSPSWRVRTDCSASTTWSSATWKPRASTTSSTVEASLQQMAATDRQHAAVIPGPTDVQIVEQAQHPVMG